MTLPAPNPDRRPHGQHGAEREAGCYGGEGHLVHAFQSFGANSPPRTGGCRASPLLGHLVPAGSMFALAGAAFFGEG